MKNAKLKLDLTTLAVQSFSPTPSPAAEGGTVHGHASMEAGCTSFQECGGAGGSYECYTAAFDCTWDPNDILCFSEPIAYPTEWRCDTECRETTVC